MERRLPRQSPALVERIKLGVSGLVLVGLAFLCLDIWSFARAVDDRAKAREAGQARHALFILAEATAAEHLVLANSPDAYRHFYRVPDAGWIETEFWARTVLDPGEQALLLGSDGQTILSRRASSADVATPTPAEVKRLQAIASRLHELYAQSQTQPSAERMFRGLYLHDTMLMSGKPALVSVIAIAPSQIATEMLTHPPIALIHVTPVDERLQGMLSEITQLRDIRLATDHQVAESSGAGNSVRLPVADSVGDTVAVLTWRTDRPGTSVLAAILPAIVVSGIFIALQGAATGRTLSRMAHSVIAREQDAVQLSRTDPATGLANRRWFHAAFGAAISDGDRATFGVVMIDLDYFKEINDEHGHACGDAVLNAVAERIRTACPGSLRLAARLGGDEFAVMTETIADRQALDRCSEALRAAIMVPVMHEGKTIPVSASLGAALWPQDGAIADQVLAAADLALYRAKRDGRGRARVYDAGTDLSAALRGATERGASDRTDRAAEPERQTGTGSAAYRTSRRD